MYVKARRSGGGGETDGGGDGGVEDPAHGRWNDESCRKRKRALCFRDSCEPGACSGQGNCVEVFQGRRCACWEGYDGEACEKMATPRTSAAPSCSACRGASRASCCGGRRSGSVAQTARGAGSRQPAQLCLVYWRLLNVTSRQQQQQQQPPTMSRLPTPSRLGSIPSPPATQLFP
uniref:L-selectin-like n=1 Tax=Petromyzon marinus TaxID=7757 RepID=A0AAJ7UFJ4_PETMA|nr:L-selectin-like [Petromyzon marinus]